METEAEDPATDARNRRVGILLFAIYASVYAGFVWISAFRTTWIEMVPWAGVNIAVWYGLGLIAGAFVLALVYGWACRAPVAASRQSEVSR
jgi:uncharacterized membrane protein (DUF485 family)